MQQPAEKSLLHLVLWLHLTLLPSCGSVFGPRINHFCIKIPRISLAIVGVNGNIYIEKGKMIETCAGGDSIHTNQVFTN